MTGFSLLICAVSLVLGVILAQRHLPVKDFFPLLQDANTTELFPMPACGTFQLHEATIQDMQIAMDNGSLTSTQLVLCYLERAYQTQTYLR
jgi:amidase